VARLGSKPLDDSPVDDDPDFLNFVMAVSCIGRRTSFLPQKYWPDPGKPDGPVFMTLDASLAISVFNHEDVEGDFWTRLWLTFLILLPSANFWIFGSDHPQLSLISYDDLFALSRLSLRWLNQDLLLNELDRIHVSREQIFVELHLGTLHKLQSSFVYDRLNLLMKNIAIISSMRIGIMSFIIFMLF
jgi:hypothetical protein